MLHEEQARQAKRKHGHKHGAGKFGTCVGLFVAFAWRAVGDEALLHKVGLKQSIGRFSPVPHKFFAGAVT